MVGNEAKLCPLIARQLIQRQPRLLQQGLRLGNLGQGRLENLGAAVGIVPLLGLKAWLWWRHLLGGKDVPVLKQV